MSMAGHEELSRPRRSKRRLLLAGATVAILAVAILVIAMLATGREPGDTGTGAKSAEEHRVSATAGDQTSGKFEIASTAESLVVNCSDTGDDLYRAITPPDGSMIPKTTQDGDATRLTLVSSGATGAASAEVLLNAKVTWDLTMAGGGLDQKINCGTGSITALELGQGARSIEVALPAAKGTLPIRLTGGAGKLSVHLAKNLPVQVKIGEGAGAGAVTIDGTTTRDIKPGTELTPADWAQAADRYTIEVGAGLASMTVDRH